MAAPKVALITGANRGIGLETARQLGRLGFTVLLGVRTLAKGVKAVGTLRQDGITARAVALDVADEASIQSAVREISAEFPALDVLVNNAGIAPDLGVGPQTKASTGPREMWHQTFGTNLFGLVRVCQLFLPLLRAAPAARIVNVSSRMGSLSITVDSRSGFRDRVGKCDVAYACSKAAVNMFTLHLATELADTPIKVNAAHPGWVRTDMGGPHAPMTVEEGARTLVTLATLGSDGSSGQFVHDGDVLPF